MKNTFCFIALLLLLFSCNNKTEETPAVATPPTEAPADSADTSFFPVTSYLKGQMLEFDSLEVTVLQVKTVAKKTDSVWLKKENIRPLLQPFFSEEINENNLVPFFKQSKFNDQTVGAITFTYDPIAKLPDSIHIRHWDVYVQPETGKVSKIYIVKMNKENGNNYLQQLTWESGKSAKIVNILNKPGGESEVESDTKLVWDF